MDFKCRRTLHYRLSTSLRVPSLPMISLESALVTHDRGGFVTYDQGEDESWQIAPSPVPISQKTRSLYGAEDNSLT